MSRNCRLVDSLLLRSAPPRSNFLNRLPILLLLPQRAISRARCRAPHAIAGRPHLPNDSTREDPKNRTAAKRHLIAVTSNKPSIRRTPHTQRLLRRWALRLCACPHTASQTHTLCRACALAGHSCLSPIARDGRCRAPGSPAVRYRRPPLVVVVLVTALCASHRPACRRRSAADPAHHENAPFHPIFPDPELAIELGLSREVGIKQITARSKTRGTGNQEHGDPNTPFHSHQGLSI